MILFREMIGLLADICTIFAFIGAMAIWVYSGLEEERKKFQDGAQEVEPREGDATVRPQNEEGR